MPDFRWVAAPTIRPHQCCCIPSQAGRTHRGFFDWQRDFPTIDGRVYVSVVAAEQMAQFMGWVPANQGAAIQGELDAEKQANAELAASIVELERQLAAVEVLKNGAFKQQKAPGRPPKTKAAA